MISALIFSGHLFFLLYIFTKKWQDESITSAFTNLALIIVLFSVGWSISTTIVKLFVDQKGFGIHFDADTISLTMLTIVEYFFYRFYYREDDNITEADTEK
jgi:formate hydrogenlyase subunit 3/multisubunit Na+/H+ antiporter MnhD subunit